MSDDTSSNKTKRLVLLDAHAIIHRAYHALPDFSTSKGEPTGALYGLSAMLLKIVEDLKPDYIAAAYDVKGPTFRNDAYKDYKAGRQKADDDLIVQLQSSRRIFEAFDIPIYDKQGFEADDVLGTIVQQLYGSIEPTRPSSRRRVSGELDETDTRRGEEGEAVETIIASGDMDTLQLVSGDEVKAYTLRKGIADTVMYNEKAVLNRFGFGPELIPDYKGLRGDPSDNIPGIKGIGEKTASILIQSFGTVENMYKKLDAGNEDKFKDAGITPRIIQLLKDNKEEAEFSKMLATIRRDVPIEFKFPEKTFRDAVDVKKVKALWQELEFRTLGQRLEKLLGLNQPPQVQLSHGTKSVAQDDDIAVIPAKAGIQKRGIGNGTKSMDLQNPRSDGSQSSLQDVLLDSRLRGNDKSGEERVSDGPEGRGTTSSPNNEDLEKTALALWLVNSNVTNPTLEDVLNFANTESYEEAKKAIFVELDKRNVKKVYEEIELPLIPVLHKMEKRGIKIDKEFLAGLSKTYHVELASLEKKIWKEAGMEFNINSPKQLGEILFDKLKIAVKNQKKTAGGARSTKESELEKMRDLHPIIPMIFEYRELAKLLSTYIDAIPPQLDGNNRLHTHFIQTGSTTGRMASQNPNLQNIPIKSELGRAIRKAFIVEKGYKFVSLDYSQAELRIAAFLSGDPKLIEIFNKGEDVHTSVASLVFKVARSEVTSEMRRQAKVINFGIIYGMGVLALKQNLGTSREEAQNFYNEYFETFSVLASYLDGVKAETARRGYTETFFGRRRYFEGIKSKIPYIRAQAERMAINAPIQGTEADVIKIAMKKVDDYLKKEKLEEDVYPLLQVHDELVYEIKEEIAEKVSVEIQKIMESVIDSKETKGVELKAEAAIGGNWGELK